MKMWYAEAFRWGSGRLQETEVSSATEKMIVLPGGRKQRMRSEYHAWFTTEQEGRAFLFEYYTDRAKYYRAEAHRCESAAGQWRPK